MMANISKTEMKDLATSSIAQDGFNPAWAIYNLCSAHRVGGGVLAEHRL